MVTKAYMLQRDRPPGPAMRAFHRTVVPAAADAAAAGEAMLENLSRRLRPFPLPAVGVALLCGWVFGWGIRRPRA